MQKLQEWHNLLTQFELPVIGGIQVEWLDFDGSILQRAEDTDEAWAYLRWWDGTLEGYCIHDTLSVTYDTTPEDLSHQLNTRLAKMRRLIEKGALPEPLPES